MKQISTPSRSGIIVCLGLAILSCLSFSAFPENRNNSFTELNTLAEVITIDLVTPSRVVSCGDNETITVTISNTDLIENLQNVTAVLSLPAGVTIGMISSGATQTANGFVLDNPLNANSAIVIDVTIAAGCGLVASSTTIDVTVSHDPATAAMNNMLTETSNPVDWLVPDLNIINDTPDPVNYPYLGYEFMVNTTVENPTSAGISEFTYCVLDNAVANITDVTLGGNSLTPAPFSPSGQTCFLVTNTDIVNATGSTVFENNTLVLEESWIVDDCGTGASIERRTFYGCGATADCLMEPVTSFEETSLIPTIQDHIISIDFNTPAEISQCGPPETITVTLEYTGVKPTLENVSLFFDQVPNGLDFINLVGAGVTQVGPYELDIPDFTMAGPGNIITFDIDLQVNCDFSASFSSFDIMLTYDPLCVGERNTETETSNVFIVKYADLSIPTTLPITIDAYKGLEQTITSTVANGGNGITEEVIYCVDDNINAILQDIRVAGLTLPAAPTSPVGSSCFIVGPTQFMILFGVPYLPSNTSFEVEEDWLFVDCIKPSPDITRRAQFGCNGEVDCQMQPTTTFQTVGVRFGTSTPDLEITWASRERPACIFDEGSDNTVRITNTGDAPMKDITIRYQANSNWNSLDFSNYAIVDGNGSAHTNYTVDGSVNHTAGECGVGLERQDHTINDINLLPGQSMTLAYAITHDCACFDGQLRRAYDHQVQVLEFFDNCDEDYSSNGLSLDEAEFDAYINGFMEGPANLFPGEKATYSWNITGMELDWLRNRTVYPDAYIETFFDIPAGLDYQANSITFVDLDGTTWAPCQTAYADSDGGDDVLRIRWCADDYTSAFSVGAGAVMTICLEPDCNEILYNSCAPEFNLNVDQSTYHTIDPSCTNCPTDLIWEPASITSLLHCPPNIMPCVCPGMDFTAYDIERTNFGLADSNNDQVADGVIDESLIQKDRFIQGDTLKATFQGRISDPFDEEWLHGFAVMEFSVDDYTPINASVFINDADGATYNCNVVPITNDAANNRVIIDFSVSTLSSLGCALPAGFDFDQNDSISLCFNYQIKDEFTGIQRYIVHNPDFYISDDDFGLGAQSQCDRQLGIISQIGLGERTSFGEGSFGGCELPSFTHRYVRYFGGENSDEFPYEIRSLGIPEIYTYTKPTEFNFRLDQFGIYLQEIINPRITLVNQQSGTIPPEFFIVNGNTVQFLVKDYFNSIGIDHNLLDEGYRAFFYPKIQGNCLLTEIEDFDHTFSLRENVDENVYCTNTLFRDEATRGWTFNGAAELNISSDAMEVRLCSPADTVNIYVTNISLVDAPNAYISITSPTGGLILTSVFDADTGIELVDNGFGVYSLGQIDARELRHVRVVVRANNCESESLEFFTGWDCVEVPTTTEEAVCSDVQSITFTSVIAGMNMDVILPTDNAYIPLCEEVDYELEVRSTNLGFLRDIMVFADLEPGEQYISNSLEIAIPSASLGGTYQVVGMDPVVQGDGLLKFNFNDYDEGLSNRGLIGSKDLTNNIVSIRFKTETTCDYLSGSRARFILDGNTSCGDLLQTIPKPAGRVATTTAPPMFQADIELDDITLNPCNMDQATSVVSMGISNGVISSLDSIRYVLPLGVSYINNSYVPITFASPNQPQVRNIADGQILVWTLDQIVAPGDFISFSIDLESNDVGQLCTSYPLSVQAFSRQNETCQGTSCSIAILSGESTAFINIVKPDLIFTSIEGALDITPPSTTAVGTYTAQICNNGSTLEAGESVTVDFYEDIDNNGIRSNADAYIFSMTEILVSALDFGECITITDQAMIPATSSCTTIAVLNPENTCTCSEYPSFQFSPDLNFDFPMEYQACHDEEINIGPDPVLGFDYEWVSVNGSGLTLVSDPSMTPTTFQAVNQTGAPLVFNYALRSSVDACFVYDTIAITVSPEVDETLNLSACSGASFNLPRVATSGSNFAWAPITGLSFPDPMDPTIAIVDMVALGLTTYVLNYDDDNGCPAQYTYRLDGVDCGIANTRLGDFVWFDLNENGTQDMGEPGIEGVQVNLYNSLTGALITTTFTDANGEYLFENLIQGNYFVEFSPLDGFDFTDDDFGLNDGVDSDANSGTGQTGSYYLMWDEENLTVDAGFVPNCAMNIEVLIADCEVRGDTLSREITITANWMGNPYTYDQFNGSDDLTISVLGQDYLFTVTDVNGSVSQTIYLNPEVLTTLTVDAGFNLNSACVANESIDIESCHYDLALVKELINGPDFAYGDLVEMKISIINQGQQSVKNVVINDYLPDGFSFDVTDNPGWSVQGANLIKKFIPDVIRVGETYCDTIKATLLPASSVNAWTNIAEIASFQDTLGTDRSMFDDDSTPDDDPADDAGGNPNSLSDNAIDGNGMGLSGGSDPATDEDDHDPLQIAVFDLALIKTITTPPPYSLGQTIEFSINVQNQGNVTATDIDIIDHIPDGFVWLAINEPAWNYTAGSPSQATTTIAGSIAPQNNISTSIFLEIQSAPEDQYVNIAEISGANDGTGAQVVDIDSNYDTNPNNDAGGTSNTDSDDAVDGDNSGTNGDGVAATDSDDHDPAFVSVSAIQLEKSVLGVLPAASGIPGNYDVTYALVGNNNGNAKLINIQLEDNIISQLGATFVDVTTAPAIVALTDATTSPSLNGSYNGGAIDNMFTGTDGCLDPGQTITVNLTVELTGLAGLSDVVNEATITGTDPNGMIVTDMDTAEVDLPACFLDVVCPVPGISLSCLSEIPTAADDIASFNAIDGVSAVRNSCGSVIVTSADSDNGGTGCTASPYVLTRTYTITDMGNGVGTETVICTVEYTVIDDDSPTIICPSMLTTECSISDVAAYADLATFVAVGGFVDDNCGITSFNLQGETNDGNTCPQTYTRVYRVVDACNNISTCNQLVVVDDQTPPVISCPAIETSCALADIPAYTTLADFIADGNTASDNCGINASSFSLIQETTDNNSCPQIVIRKYQLMDNCGNMAISTQTITIDDETIPQFTTFAPANTTISCDALVPTAPTLTATDNCDNDVTISFTETTTILDAGQCADYNYEINRLWIASDNCGNEAVQQQTITVNDNTLPTAMCCDDFSVNIGNETSNTVRLRTDMIDCGSSDNCTPTDELAISIDPISFGYSDIGDQVITLTVVDDCGNTSTCTTTVTIEDTTRPELNCPTSLRLECGNPNNATTIATWLASATATDSCPGGVTISTDYDVADFSDDCGATGAQIVTFTATDMCGNSIECTSTITIEDNVPPTLSCPPGFEACAPLAISAHSTYAAFTAASGTAADNCELDETSLLHVDDVMAGSVVTRTYQISDGCDNSITCQQLIVLKEQPTVGTPEDIIVSCSVSNTGSVSLSSFFGGATPGGTFAYTGGTGANIQGDALVYTQAGCYSVTYEFTATDAGVCDAVAPITAYLYVSEQPQPSFDLPEELCWDGSSTTLTALVNSPVYQSSAVESWRSTDTGIAIVNTSGVVTVVDAGTVEICMRETITYAACNGNAIEECTEETCHTLVITEVSEAPSAAWTSFGPLCTDDTVVDLDMLITGEANGVFTGNGVSGIHPNYDFTPSTGAGIYTITYTVSNASGCTAVETHTVEVYAPVSAALVDLDLGCITDPVGNISLSALFTNTTTLGGTFTGTGVSGNTLTYSGPGCYEVTYTVNAFAGADVACTDEATAYIYIQEQPEPSFNLTDQLCWDGVTTTMLNPIVNSPSYTNSVARNWSSSQTGVATINAMTGEITVIGTGTTTICLEETIAHTACNNFAASDCVVEVCQTLIITETNESVDASWTSFGPLCTDDTVVDLDALIIGEANGVFTGNGVSGTHPDYNFSPITGAGIYTITYTVSNASGCTAVETHTVEVYAPVSAALTDLDVGCITDPVGNISLSALFTNATTLGGTFTGTGVSGNTLTYSGPGCYEVTYTVNAFAGADVACTDESTAYIYIQEQPEPSFNLTDQLCWDGVTTTMLNPIVNSPSYTNSVARDWRSSAAAVATIDAMTGEITVIGTGTTTICLEETIAHAACNNYAANDCIVEVCQTLIITETNESVDASWTSFGPLCTDDAVVDLDALITGEANGVFTGNGVSGTHPDYNFSPIIGAGIYTITYTVSNASGCTAVETHTVEVYAPVSAALTDLDLGCITDPVGNISLSALFTNSTTLGGTFTGTGVSGKTLTYSGSGCYEVTYTVNAFAGADVACTDEATAYIYIQEQPEPSFNLTDQLCWDGVTTTMLNPIVNSPSYTNSVARNWSSSQTGVATINAMTGEITVIGTGTTTICLEETIAHTACNNFAASDCVVEVCQTLIITETNESVDASWTSFGPLCTDDAVVDLDALITGEANGVFTGNGVSGTHPNYDFTPNTGAGIYTITYTVSNASGCTAVETHTVEVYAPVSAALVDLDLGCITDPVGNISLSALFTSSTTLGGTFTGTGVSGNTLTYSGPGCYEVTYTVNAFAGADVACTDEATAYILISEQPQPSFDIQDQVCWSAGDDVLTHLYTPVINSPIYDNVVTTSFTVESGPATIQNATTGQIQVTGIGTVVLRLTETIEHDMCGASPAGSCVEFYEVQIEVSDGTSLDASFMVDNALPCLGEVINLTPMIEGGVFTGNGIIDNGLGTGATFSHLNQGVYVLTYTLNNPNGCTNTYSINVEVRDEPAVISCPDDVALTCDEMPVVAATSIAEFMAMGGIVEDDCADAAQIQGFVITSNDVDNGNSVCPDDGQKVITRTYSITDLAGNVTTCIQLFSFAEDASAPMITTTASDLTVDCDGSGNMVELDAWLASLGGAMASDGNSCSADNELTWTNVLLQTEESCGETVTYTYRFSVSDLCGNTSNTDAQFIIRDITDPIIDTPAEELTITCEDGNVVIPSLLEWLDNHGNAEASDDCGELTWTNDLDLTAAADLCATGGMIPVTFTVTDECGNSTPTIADLIITQVSALGAAKRVVSLTNLSDGSATIVYEINIENFGTVDLDSLQATDELFMTFPAPCAATVLSITSDDYLVNTAFNGVTDVNLLLGNDVLQAGDKGAILLTINVGGCGIDNGPFLNTVVVDAVQGNSDHIQDESNWGVDPDPDGNGIPDENIATPVSFEEIVNLGVAKKLIFASINPDGSFDVTYEFNVHNFGTVDFSNITLQDNLRATFPETCEFTITGLTSSEFTTNIGVFDGISNVDLLAPGNTLSVGQQASVDLSLHIINCGTNLGPFFNEAILSGMAPDGTIVFDRSVDGVNPDPDGNGVPDEFSYTIVDFKENPALGVAKRVSQGPTLRTDNYYEVTYEIRVENYGDVNLEILGVYDTLAQTFAAASDWMVIGLESEEFAVNTGFDGLVDFNLVIPGHTLVPAEQGAIYLTVKIAPGGFSGPYNNSVFGNSVSPFGTVANDFSYDGSDPDFDGDDDPTNDTLPTPVILDCFVDIVCPVVADTLFADNDLGWCQAAVNFPLAEIITCAGVPDSLIEYQLVGAGALDIDSDVWTAGQPSGLMYNVGLTEVLIRASVPSLPGLGFSDSCSFFIEIADKQIPTLLCSDITVPVGASCEYVLTPDRLDAGSTDNCTEENELIYEISLDNISFVESLDFDLDDLLNSPITVYLRVTDEYGNFNTCTNEVNLIDDTAPQIICPEDRIITAEENLCVGVVPDLMAEMTIDNCAPIDSVYQTPAPGLLFGTEHGDMLTVILTVVDINGNTDTCGVKLTLEDNSIPVFINCPAPNVVITSLPGTCSAFANFELPEARDNCSASVAITQTDNTGLTSGDLFPVGTTILEFTATDIAGNSAVCTRKIIVNDNDIPTPINGDGCPIDQVVNVSAGECGAYVHNIAPRFQDNCTDNLSIVYRILDNQGNTITDGLSDASGELFDLGTTTVEYLAQDQPLLLITEMTHDLQVVSGGTSPVPAFITDGLPDGDFLEITNFGPTSMDVSCLAIERHHAGGSESIALPRGVILAPGAVVTIHFGDGTDNLADAFFNVEGATNLSVGEGAAYVISHNGTILDVAVIGTFNPVGLGTLATVSSSDWTGQVSGALNGAVRTTVWDTNTATDFQAATVCGATTIGSYNPQFPQVVDNGNSTSLQSQLPNTLSCTFDVTVGDNEFPHCGQESDPLLYNGFDGGQIFPGDCIERTISVTDFGQIADVNVLMSGVSDAFGNLEFTLISPQGTEIDLANSICGFNSGWDMILDGDVSSSILDACTDLSSGEEWMPIGNIESLVGQAVNGTWTLRIGHNASLNTDPIAIQDWALELRLQEAYTQEDQVLENDEEACSAEFSWLHPIFYDNCPNGTIQYTISGEDGELLHNSQLGTTAWGTLATFDFPVGTSFVSYNLVDAAGNISECEFQVTVNDTENPIVICPPNLVIQLGSGECTVHYIADNIIFSDNCPGAFIVNGPDAGVVLEPGVHNIQVIVQDLAGNMADCDYIVEVLEYVPVDPAMACISGLNVSLGIDCTREITAEMILRGDEYTCYDDYILTLLDAPEGEPLEFSPFVTEEHIGQTVVVMICDPISGECCWGYVHVGFYEAPTFECPIDVNLNCIEETIPSVTGEPVLLSCALGGADISYTDQVTENDNCTDQILIITRTWTVEDGFGNSTTCDQVIMVNTFDLGEIEFPEDRDGISLAALDCADVAANSLLTHPDYTGYPTLAGTTDVFGVNYCSASYLYTDEIYNICPGSYEILRTWKVRNTCLPVVLGENPREHIQLIRVLDQENPAISCPENEVISTSPFACTAFYLVPDPVMATDGCSGISYTVTVSGGSLTYVDGVYRLNNLIPGSYTITYRVSDECNRRTTCSYEITVEDQIEPTASCNESLQISLGGGGLAVITAADLDEGSNDACSAVDLLIRREFTVDADDCTSISPYFSDWQNDVLFNCCDIGEEVRLELLVSDQQGNANTCWLDVSVEDKLAPSCTPPLNQTLTCVEWPLTFTGDIETAYATDFEATSLMMDALFGAATGIDNCTVDTIVELTPIIALNSCGWGNITRRFQAWQWNSDDNNNGEVDADESLISTNTCTQLINITEVHDFAIQFPADGEAACVDGDVSWDELELFSDGCDQLTINIGTPEIYPASDDECYKLRIEYTIINWCVWDGEVPASTLSRNEDNDSETGESFWIYRRQGDFLITVDEDNEESNGTIRQEVDRGHWRYYQFVKVFDETAPVISNIDERPYCSINNTCDTLLTLQFAVEDDCGLNGFEIVSANIDEDSFDANEDGVIDGSEFVADEDVSSQINFTDVSHFQLTKTVSIGQHTVRIVARDGCGNTISHLRTFEVEDCKAIAPICISGLTATLQPTIEGTCEATIWASDFLGSDILDCSLPIQFAIYRPVEVEAAGEDFVPDPTRTGLTLTQEDPEQTMLYVYAIDDAGNFDYCETYILVQAAEGSNCAEQFAAIAGVIQTEDAETVSGVEVNLNDGDNTIFMTGNDGVYNFTTVVVGQDYTVTPYSNNDPVNGVTTFDIILISKHILGTQLLDSPYKLIAADVNHSETVTTLDLIRLRKLILNITTEFADNTSWRFVSSDYIFPDLTNPWLEEFEELRNYNNLDTSITDADFIAVKIGDVNSSAQTNANNADDSRTGGVWNLLLPEMQLSAGEIYEIPVRLSDQNIAGCQFTLEWDKITVLDIGYGLAQVENLGVQYLNEGKLTASWHTNASRDMSSDVLFTLSVLAEQDLSSHDLFNFSDRYTPSEAYSLQNDLLGLGWAYDQLNPTLDLKFELYQNTPNPFKEESLVSFYVPQAGQVDLKIHDVHGALIWEQEEEYDAGFQKIWINAKSLGRKSGVYSCTLRYKQELRTRKMVLVMKD